MRNVWIVLICLGSAIGGFLGGTLSFPNRVPTMPDRPIMTVSATTSAAPSAPRVSLNWRPSTAVAPPVPEMIPPPAGIKVKDLDIEVCRSINTTCGGFFDQTRCDKGPRSWTALLPISHVNCIIAAQGLVSCQDRARWIQACEPTINCHPGC
jgi:hypothetical protein